MPISCYARPWMRALAALGISTVSLASSYQQPPAPILEVMRAPKSPSPYLDPSKRHLLLVTTEQHPSIERVARPYLKLAGMRLEPANRSRHDTPGGYGIPQCVNGLALSDLQGLSPRPFKMPQGCAQWPLWSADGERFALVNITASAVELWVGETRRASLRKVPNLQLNPMLLNEVQWMADQKTLLVKARPSRQGPPPSAAQVDIAPSIQESLGASGQSSTYEARDTLNNPHDEALFDYYAQSQLTLVDSSSGRMQALGQAAPYSEVSPSPDGKHVLVMALHKPYSYVTTWERFPYTAEVWTLGPRGQVARNRIADLPLADRVPIHGVPTGPRALQWRANAPASLIWAEALDGGDWASKVDARDKVMSLAAPFKDAPREVLRTEMRFSGLAWRERSDEVLLQQYDHNRQWRRSHLVRFDAPQTPWRLLWDFSSNDRYNNPGSPVEETLANGQNVLREQGGAIFLAGQGASRSGNRPFLDKLDLASLQTERLFRSDSSVLESFYEFAERERSDRLLTWRQSPQDPPNLHLRTLAGKQEAASGEAVHASSLSPITQFTDPSPQLRQIKKELVKYKREDGLELSFTLYTPPNYKAGERLPAVLNAYPLDYASSASAGQVSGSANTFTRLREYQMLLLAGYAIIDNAAFPIVGDPQKAYDSYLSQLVANARAAINKAVDMGVVDPERIGVTGHSHGALMTVNLLAHSDLFRAGFATSGSYNKSLTPFGFQSERRSIWEAPQVYREVSPFFFADKIKTPLLIMHGADDANPGTPASQANKLYEAVRGNGGTTRLVMLPHEPHWYTARESKEQQVYEMLNWFDRYVKAAPPSQRLATDSK